LDQVVEWFRPLLGNRQAQIDIGLEAGSRSSSPDLCGAIATHLLGLVAFRHNLRWPTLVAGAELVAGTWSYDLSSKAF
jgi:hypothetical protein